MKVTFYLNDILMSFDVKENEYLAETLRKSGLKSIRLGCNETSCGACTVLIDNKPVLSCGVLTGQVDGCHVITVEGIQDEALKSLTALPMKERINVAFAMLVMH